MQNKHNSSVATPSFIPYVIPFAVFLIFTGITSYTSFSLLWGYPLKIIIVGVLLILFRKSYNEVSLKFSFLALIIGIAAFAIWVIPTNYYPLLGTPKDISPYELAASKLSAVIWICLRLIGAVVIVPIMEELFWRSFLLRYVIDFKFKNVPIGKFGWFSFISNVILFGVEHQQWVAGIIAGTLYTLLLYRTKSIFACILAHSVTNLALGIYVLITHQWFYW